MKSMLRYNSFMNETNIYDLKVGQKVKYKKLDNSEVEKPIERMDFDNKKVFFKDKQGKEFSKNVTDIIVNVEPQKTDNEGGNIVDKVKDKLTQIKDDKPKMKKVLDFLSFVKPKK